ncbi:MAG TPA: hypothetical protein VG939_02430 [Caulobacteraceae bacterium]|nr:hypothetical protein [Caulobacteraceae bacterium]
MSEADPKGYYAVLGCDPKMPSWEIKDRYRNLISPPDGGSPTEEERGRIEEAFAVLGDRDRRDVYDGVAPPAAAPALSSAPPMQRRSAIRCEHCRKPTSQPRRIAFFWTISVVVMSFKNPMQGVYCPACARRDAILASLLTGFLGWWGVPWGPIFSVQSIFGNAFGGKTQRHANAAMAWNNVMAAYEAGQFAEAYALSQAARGAYTELARDASALEEALRQLVAAPSRAPADPWKRPSWHAPAALAAGLALPLLLVAVIAFSASTAPARADPPQPPAAEPGDVGGPPG